MLKKSIYRKKESIEEMHNKHNKKENTLDYYISKASPGINEVNWWSKNETEKTATQIESKKHEFLKKNIKASSIIPAQVEKKREFPNKMGYFDTPFGTVEVGYRKYKRNSLIGFSLVPESVKGITDVPNQKTDDPDAYFGGTEYGSKKRFRAGKLSFKYDPQDKGNIKKLEKDNDGIVDEEEKLLYQVKREDEKIEYLKSSRHQASSDREKIDKEIAKIRDIKEEKEKDNIKFLKEIDNFVDKIKKGKLKRYVDSDDFISRRKRIVELSSTSNLSEMDLEELKKLLKELLKKEDFQKLKDKFSKIDFENLTEKKLQNIIINLTHGSFGEST